MYAGVPALPTVLPTEPHVTPAIHVDDETYAAAANVLNGAVKVGTPAAAFVTAIGNRRHLLPSLLRRHRS